MKKRSLRKIDYLVLAIITLVFLFIIAMNIKLIAVMTNSQAEEVGVMQLDGIKNELQETLSDAENALMKLSVGIEQIMSKGGSEKELEEYIISQKKEQMQETGGRTFNVYASGRDWEIIPDFNKPDDYHGSDRVWYKGAESEDDDIYITEPYVDSMSGEICFTMSVMLSDKETVAAMDFSLAGIQESIDKMIVGDDRKAIIVTDTGKILGYSEDMSLAGEPLALKLGDFYDIYYEAKNNLHKSGFRANIGNRTNTVFYSVTNNGWYMILCVDNDALYSSSNKQIALNVSLNALMLLIIILFYIRSAKNRIKAENALKTKEEFLANLSEDFREPLNRIIKLTNPSEQEENGSETLSSVRESGLQLSEMFDNLFSYSILKNERGRVKHSSLRGRKSDFSRTIKRSRNLIVGMICILVVIIVILSKAAGYIITLYGVNSVADGYKSIADRWASQQKAIVEMFANTISADSSVIQDYDKCVKWLDRIAKKYDQISVCYLANPYSDNPIIMNNGWLPEEGWKVEERQWYVDTERSENGYNVSMPYYDEQTGDYCITFSKVVYGENDEFLGIFGIDFFIDKLIEIVGGFKMSGSYAFLVDKEGVIINHPNTDYQIKANNLTVIDNTEYAVVPDNGDIVTLRDYNGRKAVVSTYDISTLGLKMYVACDRWNLTGSFFITCIVIISILSAILAVILVLINKIIKWQNEVNIQLSMAVSEARAAGKAKSQFLAQMSHEIRTPINAVIGMDEMILRESNDEEILEYAGNIHSAGKTLLNLINGILDFSKLEDGKMQILQVKYETVDMITDLVNMNSEKAVKKGLEFKTEIDPMLPVSMLGDDVRIRQIITNILTNAIKYTPSGSVTLKIGCERIDNDSCELNVSVTDTGIGIRKEDMEKLFQSFARLDEEKNRNIEGTGLGISIVQGLLSLMGSELKVESEYGKGSCFSFDLKQRIIDGNEIGDYKSHKHSVKSEMGSEPEFYAVDADVLVVDDNEMNLKVAKGLMKRCGIVPDLADSGQMCIDMVREKHYDIIFLDHMMPIMDGIETLHRLISEKRLIENTAVIALTANAIEGVRDEYISEGFIDYLSKPIEVAKLEEMLATYLPPEKIKPFGSEESEKKSEEKTEGKASEIAEESEDTQKLGKLDRLKKAGINTEAGLEFAAGSEEFYLEMLSAFREEADDRMQELKALYDSGNIADYRTKVHALKSNARMLGADELSALALAQENAAKEENFEEIINGIKGLFEEYEKIKKLLDRTL